MRVSCAFTTVIARAIGVILRVRCGASLMHMDAETARRVAFAEGDDAPRPWARVAPCEGASGSERQRMRGHR